LTGLSNIPRAYAIFILAAKLERGPFDSSSNNLIGTSNNDDFVVGSTAPAAGEGLRAITCSAFLLALLKRCLAKARPHLGLLVLDSPLLAYWKPEGQADDLRGTRVDECFYRWMRSLPASNQVIVIENRPLPKWVSDVAHVIHFTKNKATGRYGLFEVE